MKNVSILLFFLLFVTVTNAQFKTIAEGPDFEEPESGLAKIVQLKNGNTVFLVIKGKDGIDVKVYDATHKLKAEQHIEPAYGKLKDGDIEAIFEINGSVTLLISERDGRTPVLYRLVIDGSNGGLKEEKQIENLDKVKMMQGYAMVFGNVPPPAFYVRKDPYSENYAVALMNSFEGDRNKRIEIVFYGADHKEISRAYYKSPDDKYKYLEFIDMVVIGNKKVSVLAYAYNTGSSGGREREMILANLDAKAAEVTIDRLSSTKDMYGLNGLVRYNPVTQKLILLAVGKEEKKAKEYSCFLMFIDPFLGKTGTAKNVYLSKVNDKSLELFGRKEGFSGMPQNLYVNNDGSFSIVFETVENITVTTSNRTYTNAVIGNIAVAGYDQEGKLKTEYFIPKRHKLPNTYIPTFYLAWREGTAQRLYQGNQFKSFAYLSTADKNYVLFNDVEKNGESVQNGDITTILGVSDCDGFYFNASGKEIMPERQFVFGEPDSKRNHNLALFSISDYNKETNTYVTLKLMKEGRHKGVAVVWLQPK